MAQRFIGVDVGGTKVSVAVLEGNRLSEPVLQPTELTDSDRLVEQLVSAIGDAGPADAVGIGVPSVIDFATGTARHSVNVPLQDVPLRRILTERLKMPVFVDNDATCAALAEAHDDDLHQIAQSLVLLTIVFIVAAVWRGRRLGPLVIENLPVTVKSSETMLGRARLYEKSSARLRALDALRVGTVQRLATACGLPSTATVDDVIASVAVLAGAPPHEIRSLLLDAEPASDAELVEYSDALLRLEHEVAERIRP